MVGMNEITRTYQLINSYGVIGDGHLVVLVSPDGSVDGGCLPDFDSPAILCHLLDAERGGYFQIASSEGSIPLSPKYEERTRESRNHLCSFFAQLSRTQSESLCGIGI